MNTKCLTCGKDISRGLRFCSNACQAARRDTDQSRLVADSRDKDQSHTVRTHRDIAGSHCTECKAPLDVYWYSSKSRSTCGDKCRKRRERRLKDSRSAWIGALHEIGKMRDLIKRRENDQATIEQLNRLKAEINDLLQLAGDADEQSRRQMLQDRFSREQRIDN